MGVVEISQFVNISMSNYLPAPLFVVPVTVLTLSRGLRYLVSVFFCFCFLTMYNVKKCIPNFTEDAADIITQ